MSDKIYPRWQADTIKKALKTRRVVIVSGPRQSGKTTLVKRMISGDSVFLTLDDDLVRKTALSDPLGFVRQFPNQPLIIDEVQKAPSLITAIKQAVDDNNKPGQFLLTGSSNIQQNPEIAESLAGRVRHIRLRTLCIGETLKQRPSFLDRAFAGEWPVQVSGYDRRRVIELAFRGGYPEPLSWSLPDKMSWHLDYVESVLTRDLLDIAYIKRKNVLRELVGVFNAWSSKYLDTNSICAQLNITRPTFHSYANALQALYLFQKLPAWGKTDYKRVGHREKLYATDTGLMASLLNWRFDDVMLDADRCGKIVETLVFNELAAQADLSYEYSLFHYRDRAKREIDFIVENRQGEMLGIEVKAGSMVGQNDCRHLRWFRDNIKQLFRGIVLYTGENSLRLEQNIHAVPIAALWS
jgi:predicted AAA+ superfamily ATPase